MQSINQFKACVVGVAMAIFSTDVELGVKLP